MRGSLRLITVRGIDIRLHFTFPLILIWAALQFGLLAGNLSGAVFGVVAILILFGLVTLHELGHSFAAQYYDVTVKQIVLSPIGGVAQLSHIPEKPVQEFVIALAGPAVNLMAALLMALVLLTPVVSLGDPAVVMMGVSGFSLGSLFSFIFFYNILLGLFNMIPAFPLDGGRIFRSLLAMRLDYVRATQIAAAVGKITAIAIGIYGLYNGGFFLIFIAFFIYVGATQESNMVQIRSLLRDYTVEDVYSPSVYRLLPDSTVQQARNILVYGGQRNFPVADGDLLVGFLTHFDFLRAAQNSVAHTLIAPFMRKDIKPASFEDDLFLVQQRLIEERIEALPVVHHGRFMGIITLQHIAELRRQLSTSPSLAIDNHSA
ncbi:MAG: site-2 protease family protein [Anaerolineae bacterium]|nr:MAG: site-2 protease family protein [Anaerolineae bacterium]